MDKSGNLWLFGGWGYDSAGTFGVLNDLWEYQPAGGTWTWVGGNKTVPDNNDSCWPGVYGTLGVAAAGNFPGGRQLAVAWTDSNGGFWLSGGGGCDANGIQVLLNDLWKFDPATQQWAWISGSSTDYRVGSYGTLGTPDATNVPGSRWEATSWSDSKGNLWLFGGNGIDGASARGYLNDLWKFDTTTSEWTWISGSSTVGTDNCYMPNEECARSSVYGTLGQAAASNVPGGRNGSVGSVDSQGNLWLFAGANDASSMINFLNDLWKFNPATNQWTWIAGSNTVVCGAKDGNGNCVVDGHNGVYGTQGNPASTNMPGSRNSEVSWTGKSGNLWLFGGNGFDASTSLDILNDLWEFELKQMPAIVLVSNANPVFGQNAITFLATVSANGESPTGTVNFLDGSTSIGTASLDGSGKAALTVSTLTTGSHSITASYGGDSGNFSVVSSALAEVVEDFALTLGTTTTASISSGGSASYSFTVSPVAPATTMPGAITLIASGGPAGATYSFSPASIAAGGGSTPVTLKVTLPAASASAGKPKFKRAAFLALTFLLLPLAGRLRKSKGRWGSLIPAFLVGLSLWTAAVLAGLAGMTGCGKGGSSTVTQPLTYSITITGTAGGLNHSQTVTLTVN
jgi:N-acetylneuraminic acid mutarotase